MSKRRFKNYLPESWQMLVVSLLLLIVIVQAFITTYVLLPFSNDDINTSEEAAVSSNFLHSEEVVIVPVASSSASSTETQTESLRVEPSLFEYVEVVDGCGPHFEGECLNVRGGPGTDFPVYAQLRNGIVLKVGGVVERYGEEWYRIVFDEYLRYPERQKGEWYVKAEYVSILYDEGDKTVWEDGRNASSTKKIVVDRGEQMLYAYDGEELFMETKISTGLELTPTPRGTFTIFKKTPSRYMQGPLPNLIDQQVYDLPGVPWNLYFTQGGAVIHGAYWHTSFGSRYSHGCVNVPLDVARKLYDWAELGTIVVVHD